MCAETDIQLNRIAQALERLSPALIQAEFGDADTFLWSGRELVPVENFSPVSIDLLAGIDAQKSAVLGNCQRLAAGHAAHDILLWGARGSGKSALVKSAISAVRAAGKALRLVEASTDSVASLPTLLQRLSEPALPTILFLDDLGFATTDDAARHLRSVLDGGAMARPNHVRIYATSNRRHIVPRNLSEQESAINPRDAADDNLALADRFGLSLGFHACDQNQYLAMVAGYATAFDLAFDEGGALLWSTQRGARSGRVAWHYIVELAGRAGKKI